MQLQRGCGQFIDESGLLSLMVLVLISWDILTNRWGRLSNEIPTADIIDPPEAAGFYLHSFASLPIFCDGIMNM